MFLKALELTSDLLMQPEVVSDAGMEGMGERCFFHWAPCESLQRRKVHEEQRFDGMVQENFELSSTAEGTISVTPFLKTS